MKTQRLLSSCLSSLFAALFLLLVVGKANAVATTVLLNEDFNTTYSPSINNSGFPPGWSGTLAYQGCYTCYYPYGGWMKISQGYGGNNGSMGTSEYYPYVYGFTYNISTPPLNTAVYAPEGDELYLEYDRLHYSYYYEWYYQQLGYYTSGAMSVRVLTPNGSKVLKKYTSVDYTVTSTGYAYAEPYIGFFNSTDPMYWKHEKISIPNDYRTANMQIDFLFERSSSTWYYYDEHIIDNVRITGTHYNNLVYDQTSLNFGSVQGGVTTPQQCVTVTNPSTNNATIAFKSVKTVGTNASEYSVVSAPTSLAPGQKGTICVTFTPAGKANRQALVEVVSTADQSPNYIDLRGFGLVPIIEFESADMFRGTRTRFDNTFLQKLVVKNTGGSPLKISNTTFINGDWPEEYSIVKLPTGAIAPGAKDTIYVSYTPHYEGAHPAILNVISNADNGPQQIVLRGVGILPRLVVSPTVLRFDSSAIGEKQCTMITLYNPGTDTIRLNSQYLSSADADFTFTKLSGLDTLIPPEKSRQIEICFNPVRNGSRVAKLRLTTNIPLTFETPRKDTSALVLDIIGTGVPFGALAVMSSTNGTDSVLVGKEICRVDTFYNTGSSDITITGVTVAGANSSEFSVSGVNFPVTVQPGKGIPFSVCATPDARGQRTATATASGLSNGKAVTAVLPLTVVGQEACSNTDMTSVFGTTGIGMTDEQTVTITNCGDVSETYLVASTGSDYTVVSQPTGPVAPGGTTTFKVSYKPVTCGISAGTLTVTPSVSTAIPITVNGSGVGSSFSVTGNEPIKTEGNQTKDLTITVTNTGTLTWTPGNSVVSGPFAIVAMQPQGPLAPGASATVTIRYTPSKLGTEIGSITVVGTPQECTQTVINLQGENASLGVKTVAEKNGYRLEQNYPNPFNPTTEIRFSVPSSNEVVKLMILDVKGEVVRTLVNEKLQKGDHKITLDAKDLASGTYFYQLTSGQTTLIRSMMLAK